MAPCRPRPSRPPRAPHASTSTARLSRRCSRRCPPSRCRWPGPGPGARPTLVAGVALPPFDNSAMDGYAVRAADVPARRGDPVELPVAADIPAGRTDVPPLEPGTAHRIMTGAPLPAGADAVVQVEHTDGGHRPGAGLPRRPRRARRSAGRARTSPRARSSCPRARCSARRRSASRPRSARRRCRCAVGPSCSCCPPAPNWSPRARRCSRGRSTSRTGRCSPPRSRTPGVSPSCCASCPTTSRTCTACSTSGWTPGRRPGAHLGRDQRRRLRGGQGSWLTICVMRPLRSASSCVTTPM